ncbi:hypothetical protein CL620_06170 [archaeon]|nr:hypothetical protein [archaeon]
MYYVNVYELDRVYGGPEEGGWWYTSGEAMDSAKCFTEWGANIKRGMLRKKWKDTSDVSMYSVMYSGGVYDICIEDEEAHDFPKERPVYE